MTTKTAVHDAPPPVVVRSFYALSAFGCWWIRSGNLGTSLSLDGEYIATFDNPFQAARAVAAHRSGHHDWDRSGFLAPDHLRDWGQLIQLGGGR